MGVRDKLRHIGASGRVRYAASLPERAIRSASALAAGTIHEVASVALPAGLRRGRLYRSLVDVTLRFLIENVGGATPPQPSADKVAENFLLRRAAGNGIELMGIVAFRASPVWVLAALADIAGFGRELIPEIAATLKKEGLLAADGSFATMEQLLAGLERGAGQLAENVNSPPLDVASLRNEWQKLAAEAKRLPALQLPAAANVTQIWRDLQAAAEREQRSVFQVSSLLALTAVGSVPERARMLSRSAAVVLRHGGATLATALLDHYSESLRALRAEGFLGYGARQLAPYTRAAAAAFSPAQPTLTDRLLDKL